MLRETLPPADAPPASDAALERASTADAWLKQLPQWAPELQRAAIWQLDANGQPLGTALAGLPSLADAALLKPIAAPASRQGQARGPVIARLDGVARIDFPVPQGEAGGLLVCLALADLPSLDTQRLMRQLHWGVAWLLRLADLQATQLLTARLERARFVIDANALMLDQSDPRAAALALANMLALRFGATLVQVGEVRQLQTRLFVRSNTATFDARTRLSALAEAAMNEAVDERALLLWPPQGDEALGTAALADYAHAQKAGALALLPLLHRGEVSGVLMLERDTAFTAEEGEALQVAALSMAPILALHAQASQGALQRLLGGARAGVRTATDASHPALKLGALVLAGVLAAAVLVPVPQRVLAHAAIEGEVQRAAVAPFAGYVRQALVRAGDTVQAGQLMAVLDDKDLRLERLRLESELEVSLRKEREAIAAGNRVDTRLAAAQSGSVRAQLDLVLEKLQRVRIVAPSAGVVIKGDLSQQIGAPVEQGKVLFEVAPLDDWRVVLEVDERDTSLVALGQAGRLVLTTLPGQAFDFSVRRITAVSTAKDGRNYFRVEAKVAQPDARLRPGLEGVAKVDTGESPALWAWTRHFRQWVRVTLWEHLP
ncbi:HlyD family efflux transporter periplasmic adaptor subunit [Pseudorhodoferax sp. Leaf267]|uniref:HlyD family efflux transporter periplasmic adaptor subunit n=1 Tax=Pseudorhodoferax sp. Leaf267 TaxID=1736316 RepID=UPI0007016AD1|nr:HlyD family efflux transporter periplasmic adaptor subunit [Pseudorhodoferax sp. Leaf267]KQP11835.1 hypothetical protein ASF43_23050 [Pseudorhodoferax sp. Leaf267]